MNESDNVYKVGFFCSRMRYEVLKKSAVVLLVSVLIAGGAMVSMLVSAQGPAGASAHWEFEEQAVWSGTANDVQDSADSAHGIAKNGAQRVSNQEGRPGSVASFDGIDDYIEVPDSAALLPSTNAITVAGWLKINCADPNCKNDITGTMVSKRDSYVLSPNPDRSVCFYVNIGGDWKTPACSAAATLQTGLWHHVAGTYDSSTNTLSIYVDGTLKDSKPVSGAIQASSTPLCIGKDFCAGGTIQNRYLYGAVDDVFIYGRALSAEEIRTLRQPPIAAGDCATGDTKPIFLMSSESNAHVYPGSSTLSGAYKACFGKAFPNTAFPGDADVYKCKGDLANPSNRVLWVSDKTGNAHAASPSIAARPAGYDALCYGDMSCSVQNIAQGACPAGTTLIAALSAESNAHISSSASAAYPYQLCCSPKAGPQITVVGWHRAATGTDKNSMLAENKIADATKDVPFPFTPGVPGSTATEVRIIVKTSGVTDITTLQGMTIKLREVDKNDRVPEDNPIIGVGDDADDDLGVTLSVLPADYATRIDLATGKVVFVWKMDDKDAQGNGLNKAYASSGNDEKTINERFEFVATATPPTSSKLAVTESNILYAQTGKWKCDPTKLSATLWRDGKSTFTWTEAALATDKNLAGKACKGPDEQTGTGAGITSTSRDDCCPPNMQCTSQGCIPVGITQCQDYAVKVDCEKDAANLWRNKPAFVVEGPCGKTEDKKACAWMSLAAYQSSSEWGKMSEEAKKNTEKKANAQGGNLCGISVKQLTKVIIDGTTVNSEIGQCVYYYDDSAQCGADNYKTVTVLEVKDGKALTEDNIIKQYECQTPVKNCKGGQQPIPCGQPVFQLPFFGAWQALGAVVVIAILYTVMFHSSTVRRWFRVKKRSR